LEWASSVMFHAGRLRHRSSAVCSTLLATQDRDRSRCGPCSCSRSHGSRSGSPRRSSPEGAAPEVPLRSLRQAPAGSTDVPGRPRGQPGQPHRDHRVPQPYRVRRLRWLAARLSPDLAGSRGRVRSSPWRAAAACHCRSAFAAPCRLAPRRTSRADSASGWDENTRPLSCQAWPSTAWRRSWSLRWAGNASTHRAGSATALRDRFVMVSRCRRTDRHTSMLGGSTTPPIVSSVRWVRSQVSARGSDWSYCVRS
jgi:hypothetical protein